MNASLTHVALHVADLEACVAFYRDYCGMSVCHRRSDAGSSVAWLAEPGKEKEFIIVLIDGRRDEGVQADDDFGHLGFAVESKMRVDDLAKRAEADGRLVWPPCSEPYPVGYYCGVRDPGGNVVEFSFGQPLGPGAQD